MATKTTKGTAKPAPSPRVAQKSSKSGARTSKAAASRAPAPAPQGKKLTAIEQRFVEEYLVDLNATAAYRRVVPGVKAGSDRTLSARLLAKVHIQDAIAAGRQKLSEQTGITAERVIREAWGILTADPRELMEFRIGCCRHCWGAGFRYQRTDAELLADRKAHDAAKRDAKVKPGVFDTMGGGGFHKARDPNPDCPHCAGEGQGRTVFHDTRKISPAAASLFAGVKEGKEGLELKVHSKDAAMEKLFRHFGLFNDKLQLTMPTVVVKDLTGRKD